MADAIAAPTTGSIASLTKRSDLVFAMALLSIIGVLVLPIPAALLSVLLTANLSLAMLVLLVSIYTKEPLDFSTFPALLLVTTLFRLGLNVASTRLILLTGDGGSLIETFGNFVVGGSFVVGIVVFVILLIIQLMVVTKGAGRIAEVAARFTLDAMPGKQMAIDADLNAGLISEKDARERRDKIGREAEFYGAMDGASKFVKGDAIAGLIITAVNIVAGIIIGMTIMGMTAGQAIETFSILTIGDGLVSQIPSLLIAIGSGMLVTKSRSEENIGTELPRQFLMKDKALLIGACMIITLGVLPGMPFVPFTFIGVSALLLWFRIRNHESESAEAEAQREEEEAEEEAEEKVEDLIAADRINVEIGYRLIPLVDKERGGTLLERITTLRKQLARNAGLLIPPIRIKDNIQLPPSEYRITIYGEEVGHGDLQIDRLLAIDGGSVAAPIEGQQTKEPTFGLDAVWIDTARRAEAEALGYAVTDPASVFITHLTNILKTNAARLLNREDIQAMLDSIKRESPTLIKDIEENVKIGLIQKVLSLLLEEKVPISNSEKILEAIADNPQGDANVLAEQVRGRLGRAVTAPYVSHDNRLYAIIFHPSTEMQLSQSVNQSGGGLGVAPTAASYLVDRIGGAMQQALAQGFEPVLLTTAGLRRAMRQVTARFYADLPVVSYSELGSDTQVEVIDTISIDDAAASPAAGQETTP